MLLPPMEFDPLFLGGEGRSGTTLLRVMVDAHPAISCGPETHFLVDERLHAYHKHFRDTWWRRAEGYGYSQDDMDTMVRDFVRTWFETYMHRRGKRRWADKTPQSIHALEGIWRLFPTARFVHVIRDGRDVACSIIPQNWGPNNVTDAAKRWVECIWKGVVHRKDEQRYTEVRYEALATDPEPILRRLTEWIGEEFDSAMLEYHRREHDNPDRDRVERRAGRTPALHLVDRPLAPRPLRPRRAQVREDRRRDAGVPGVRTLVARPLIFHERVHGKSRANSATGCA